MSILSNKIKDKNFLKLISQGLEAGIIFNNIKEKPTLGIPQGGIASPILFNIYMHEFDKYILNYLENKENTINETENRTNDKTKIRSRNYVKVDKQKSNTLSRIKTYTRKLNKPINEYNEDEKKKFREFTKQLKKYKIKARKTKSKANNRKPVKFT